MTEAAIHIHAPEAVSVTRDTWHCPECDNPEARRVVYSYTWYGPDAYCECGDSWNEDGRRERPFLRGWRAKAKARFEKMWGDHG